MRVNSVLALSRPRANSAANEMPAALKRPLTSPATAASQNANKIYDLGRYCLPARAERDELAGAMLVQLLQQQGLEAQNASAKLGADELLNLVKKVGMQPLA